MTPKQALRLPSDLPRERVLKALKRLGFVQDREGQKHTIFQHPDNPSLRLAIPRHSRIKRHLLQGILSGVGVTEADFMARY